MRDAFPIKAVVVGPQKAGKSAFCKSLCQKQFPEQYVPTRSVDYFVCMDKENLYKFSLWDISGNYRLRGLVRPFLQGADILIFIINPLDENYELHKKNFLNSLRADAAPKPRYGYLVLFSHDDLWLEDKKIMTEFHAYKKELIAAANNRTHIFSVSAKNLNTDRVYRAFFELIKPIELQLYCDSLKHTLDRFHRSTKRRLLFKTHPSRSDTIADLKKDIVRAADHHGIIDALINAARDIRRPDLEGENKFGITLFGKHYRSYKNSGLYKLIKAEIALLAPDINLELASSPEVMSPTVLPADVETNGLRHSHSLG